MHAGFVIFEDVVECRDAGVGGGILDWVAIWIEGVRWRIGVEIGG